MLKFLKRFGFLSPIFVALFLLACAPTTNKASNYERNFTDEVQARLFEAQPPPRFTWSRERATDIQLYNLRNQATATYSVVTAFGSGAPLYACASVGFPIPYDVQLTNPVQLAAWPYNGGYAPATIEMPEPNGLYSSKNSDATWVLCAEDDGSVAPVYAEQKVLAFTRPVRYDEQTHMFVNAGAATATIQKDQGR